MHLTNYSVNKYSENFEANTCSSMDDQGHKRSISSVFRKIENEHRSIDDQDVTSDKLWGKIDDIIIKTMIGAQPELLKERKHWIPSANNQTCFQILGFDIMFDQNLDAWLLEVNTTSSLATDSPIDEKIKYDLVYETLALMNLNEIKTDKAQG